MRVFDCTTYYEEDLMMDLRFNVLNDYVDKFVVSEATFSHSGNQKKIKFNPNNFKKFKDKIIHIIVEEDPIDMIEKETNDFGLKRMNSKVKEQYFEKLRENLDNPENIKQTNETAYQLVVGEKCRKGEKCDKTESECRKFVEMIESTEKLQKGEIKDIDDFDQNMKEIEEQLDNATKSKWQKFKEKFNSIEKKHWSTQIILMKIPQKCLNIYGTI